MRARQSVYRWHRVNDGLASRRRESRSGRGTEPLIPCREGTLALDAMSLFLVADFLAQIVFKWGKEIEGDVRWLEMLAFGVRDVVRERAIGGEARSGLRRFAVGKGRSEASGEEAAGDGFGVALDA